MRSSRVEGEPEWFARALNTPSESSSIEVDGININCVCWGNQSLPGVVLIHGSNAHLEWWRFVAPFLADQFRVVALDLSGNGDSDWRSEYTGEAYADEVRAVAREAISQPRPFVVGHSFGGFVALEAGYQYGPEFGGLVLVDYTVAPPETYNEWGLRAQREILGPRTTRVYEDLDTALDRFRLLPEQAWEHECVQKHIAKHSLRRVEGGWTWKFDPTMFDDLEMGADQHQKFARMRCRTAVILGETSGDEGAQSAPFMSEMTAGKLPSFSIPGTHHHLMFEEPIALAMGMKGILLSWLLEDGNEVMNESLNVYR